MADFPVCIKCGNDSEWRPQDTKVVEKNTIDFYSCGGKDRVGLPCGNQMTWSYVDPKEKLK